MCRNSHFSDRFLSKLHKWLLIVVVFAWGIFYAFGIYYLEYLKYFYMVFWLKYCSWGWALLKLKVTELFLKKLIKQDWVIIWKNISRPKTIFFSDYKIMCYFFQREPEQFTHYVYILYTFLLCILFNLLCPKPPLLTINPLVIKRRGEERGFKKLKQSCAEMEAHPGLCMVKLGHWRWRSCPRCIYANW